MEWYDNAIKSESHSFILSRLNKESQSANDYNEIISIGFLLAEEYARIGDKKSEIVIKENLFAEHRESFRPAIALAEHFTIVDPNADRARYYADCAVSVTQKMGHFRRLALSEKARVLALFGEYHAAEQALKQMMTLPILPNSADIAPERDGFDRIPKDCLSPGFSERYERFLADFKRK
jgi:hypothetical protein